jgi:hypothetical protein
MEQLDSGLMVPTSTPERRVKPTERKLEGGSQFDDELESEQSANKKFSDDMIRLVEHIQQRPDHIIYVGSADERGKMREVLNDWKRRGWIRHQPNIRIDYGIPDGALRVGDGR